MGKGINADTRKRAVLCVTEHRFDHLSFPEADGPIFRCLFGSLMKKKNQKHKGKSLGIEKKGGKKLPSLTRGALTSQTIKAAFAPITSPIGPTLICERRWLTFCASLNDELQEEK
jgi:hypothetical protein